jgi:5-methylcytosine-specific restriction protein B
MPGGLERIWKTAILPLLAEHYFGEGRDIQQEFGLPALRKMLIGSSAHTAELAPDTAQDAAIPDEE